MSFYIAGQQRTINQRGISSLFVVMFTMILLSVITVSFTGLMIREQQRAINDDLSRSAYDAALSGVEDGKRVIAACSRGVTAACDAIEDKQCNTVQEAGIVTSGDDEVVIQSRTGTDSARTDEAYTCVVINSDTPNFLTRLENDADSVMIPLKGVGSYNRVSISWHMQVADGGVPVDLHNGSGDLELRNKVNWNSAAVNRPAILRAQLMQFDSADVNFNDLDGDLTHTAFLYPTSLAAAAVPAIDIAGNDSRRAAGTSLDPEAVSCSISPLVEYSCSAVITIPSGPDTSFLRLSSIYRAASVRVELLDNSVGVDFDGVQPSVDSTGRAADVFRRVEARVEPIVPDMPYPRATVDINGNLCKNFSVGSSAGSYSSNSCTP